jgi:hypothetical protein
MSNPLNRYIVYGVAAAVAATELKHPDPHIEPTNDTAPVQQQARMVVTSTSSAAGARIYYKTLTVEQGSSASVAAIPFRLT